MEGGRNYDSLPGDITLRIFSLLPLYLVLRLRLVCKAWYALITEFADEYLNRSKETSLGIICCNSHRISSGVFSLDISSLQIRGGIKTLMTKTLSISSSRFSFNNSINGLICLGDAENNIHVFNPTTGEFVTLPPPLSSYMFGTSSCVNGFGYCPLTKQYKAVKILQDFFKFATPVKAAVITVDAPSNSWRIIESSPPYKCSGGAIYLNATLFWLSYTAEINPLAITAFDVSDETFRIIRLPPKALSRILNCLNCLAEQEGRLCLVKFDHEKEYFEIYIMLEDFQWISQYRVSIKDFEPHCSNYYFSRCEFLCFRKGKITLWSKLTQRRIFYDIKSRAVETIQVGDADEKMIASHELLICPYEESLTPICSC